ncbi:YycH family regulatory protein [Bacillus alkalicellulosilyticus]|uniref:YycH family regulatory protein n=1 Tax=Alkalihalobacterium alkalicellulosilyticum TaxID=1912214 RepID=UPI000995E49B|nr:two-component system activity regulator YycH [Bacillus alkalicellulosilyticus]
MTYENFKSAVLTILVCLSLFLTWKLWTFQPNYSLLSDTDYIESVKIGEEKKLSEVIVPKQVIFQVEDELRLLGTRDDLFLELYEQLLTTGIKEVNIVNHGYSVRNLNQSILFVLPTSLPIDVFMGLFNVDFVERELRLNSVDQFFLYFHPSTETVNMRLISFEEQRAVDLETSFSVADFQNVYLGKASEFPIAFAFPLETDDVRFIPMLFLPEERLQHVNVSYTTTPISLDLFKQLFFSDFVKEFRQGDGNESFTDGNRMINVIGRGNYMDYINPVFSEIQTRSGRHITLTSFDFINAHGGWTDQYVLDRWSSEGELEEEEARFRLNVNGLPVIRVDGQDMMQLVVTRSGNQTSRYIRPLFDLDFQPIYGATWRSELLSGHEVLEQLNKREGFDQSKIEDLTVGYEMVKTNAIVTGEPYWFLLYDGFWEKLDFEVPDTPVDTEENEETEEPEDGEGEEDGLE